MTKSQTDIPQLVERLRGWSGTLHREAVRLAELPGSPRVRARNGGKAHVAGVQSDTLLETADLIEALAALPQSEKEDTASVADISGDALVGASDGQRKSEGGAS